MALSTVRLQPGQIRPGSYSSVRTNARERRMSVTFCPTANGPTLIYHGLGFVPSGYEVVGRLAAAHIYNDFPLPATSRSIVLKCDTANAVADILIR